MSSYESQLEYLLSKSNGEIEDSWEQAVDELGLNMHPDNLRKSWTCGWFCGSKVYEYFLNKNEENMTEEQLAKLEQIKFEILKERKKKQTVNREYHKTARIEGRNELFQELMLEELKYLKPIDIKTFKHKESSERTAMIFISDAHYGKQFELQGLYGEVINSYNTEIFKTRMWNLLSQIEAIELKYDDIIVCDLGDCIDGILRMGSLQKLETPVINAVIEYAEFMSVWLCELYNRTGRKVTYALTGGNHDMLRLLTEKKIFQDENIAKIIHEFISLRIKSVKTQNKDAEIYIKPYNDNIYHDVHGVKVMTYHGDSKDLKSDIDFFENFYDCSIDLLVTGHLHRNSQESIGVGIVGDREVIRVPSIMGVDDYAKSIRKHSRAGCKMIMFTENGKDYEKTFYLN